MKVYGELLILFLLFMTNIRVFSLKRVRTDSLVALAPFSLLLSILLILAWKVDIITIVIFILAVLVFLSNFHALFRYKERLFIDSYTVLMKIWAIITTILTSLAIITVIKFFPVMYKSSNLGVNETVENYTGSFKDGLVPANFYQKVNANIYHFTPVQQESSENLVVLFFPDKCGDTEAYKPYLQFLAQKGFNVYSADFYVNDCKWMRTVLNSKILRKLALIFENLNNSQKFNSKNEFYSYNIYKECENLIKILDQKYNNSVTYFLVDDIMGNSALEDFIKLNPQKVEGIFHLSSIEEYQSAGYGLIAQTNPLFARILDIPRDTEGFYTKYLVLRTQEAINQR